MCFVWSWKTLIGVTDTSVVYAKTKTFCQSNQVAKQITGKLIYLQLWRKIWQDFYMMSIKAEQIFLYETAMWLQQLTFCFQRVSLTYSITQHWVQEIFFLSLWDLRLMIKVILKLTYFLHALEKNLRLECLLTNKINQQDKYSWLSNYGLNNT